MDKPKLILEYFVAGVLTIIAIYLLGISLFPLLFKSQDTGIISIKTQESPFFNPVLLSTVFIAIAYSLGIVMEYIGKETFEWWLNRIKKNRMEEFLVDLLHIDKNLLLCSPILKGFADQKPNDWDGKELSDCIGDMRFSVMSKNTELYKEIANQISLFRLIRVLCLVEGILAIAALLKLNQNPNSGFWQSMLVLILFILFINIMAVRSRFRHYCRTVLRSYRVLMYDKIECKNKKNKKISMKSNN